MKTCKKCSAKFKITQEDLNFYKKISPQFGGKTFLISEPTKCPDCRQQQRLSFRNLRSVYMRKCDLTQKNILSIYDKDCKTPVYSSETWWGDDWDALDYGRDFDFNKTFFEQFKELYHQVPLLQNSTLLNENCDYINGAANCKDCYLSFNMDYCESCYYITECKHMTSCVDCLSCTECELCYQCVTCEKSYNLQYSQRSVSCQDSYFLNDCRQCKNCIACFNLVGKEFHIFNKPVSKQEFEKFKAKLENKKEIEKIKDQVQKFETTFPRKFYFGHSNEEFSGDRIQNIKNSYHCFDAFNIENCKYCYYLFDAQNCMDLDIFGDNSQWIYNSIATGFNCSNNSFCVLTFNGSSDNLYCNLMSGSHNNFGCSGLKQKKYCILNKQYSKEEYEKLVPKIIKHMKKKTPSNSPLSRGESMEWGEFFPPEISLFGYNETQSSEFHPRKKEAAIQEGFNWKNILEPKIPTKNIIEGKNVPENISLVHDSITDFTLLCKKTQKPFKITSQELKFYRKNNIPLPNFHPEERHFQRLKLQNPRKLYNRACQKCEKKIETSYPPENPHILYCQDCYLKNIY